MSRTSFRVNLQCQGTPYSKQAKDLKFKWQQRDSNPQLLNSQTNTQPFSQTGFSYLPNSGSQFSIKIKKLQAENKFAKLELVRMRVKLNQLSWSFYMLPLRHCLTVSQMGCYRQQPWKISNRKSLKSVLKIGEKYVVSCLF